MPHYAAACPPFPCSGGRDGQPALSVIYASNAELQEFKSMEKGSRQGSTAAVAAYIQVRGFSWTCRWCGRLVPKAHATLPLEGGWRLQGTLQCTFNLVCCKYR